MSSSHIASRKQLRWCVPVTRKNHKLWDRQNNIIHPFPLRIISARNTNAVICVRFYPNIRWGLEARILAAAALSLSVSLPLILSIQHPAHSCGLHGGRRSNTTISRSDNFMVFTKILMSLLFASPFVKCLSSRAIRCGTTCLSRPSFW